MYVSITGLRPKGFLGYLRFWPLAVRNFNTARKSPGNLFCEVKSINGYQHTLTVWESKTAMLAFVRSETHVKAIKAFHSIATGSTWGYESDRLPSWTEALEYWRLNGKVY